MIKIIYKKEQREYLIETSHVLYDYGIIHKATKVIGDLTFKIELLISFSMISASGQEDNIPNVYNK